ncbi:MAG: hypothetical protein ACUVS2_17915 [Candidatus Flexifilum sp.]|jgi:indole-3-glycerol phosphate synthase
MQSLAEPLVDPLEQLIARKRAALSERKARTPIAAVRALASLQKRPQPVLSTVAGTGPVLLFGQIRYAGRAAYDPVALALRFARHGLDGLTVFTDEIISPVPDDHEPPLGLHDLALVTRAVRTPVLTQDYLFDEYQVVEVRAAGAAAVFLSARLLDPPALRGLISVALRNRMTPIVRVTSRDELDAAVSGGAPAIALGERDSRGALNLNRALELRAQIPCCINIVLEPALLSYEEAAMAGSLKPDALVIDELLLTRPDALGRLRAAFQR